MLLQVSGQNLPRKRKGWHIAALLGALICAGGVVSTALLTDHEYRLGDVCFAVRTLESDRDPVSSDLIAPPGLHYHDFSRLDANYWTWRSGRRYCRFPH